jgi:biopolymer transport protein ExbD
MAKRQIEEINASSMADIAFLLLVFFLVTTTFSKEKVVPERLPQRNPNEKQEDIIVNPKNVLEIVANKNDLILLENEYAEIADIPDMVRKFYVHEKALELSTWPNTTFINAAKIDSEVAKYTAQGKADSVEFWQKKYDVIKQVGDYNEISNKAIITITVDNSTKFKTYLGVYDAVLNGINSLREELCQEKFDRPYASLNDKIEEDKAKKDAIDAVYPKRIMKAKNIVTN